MLTFEHNGKGLFSTVSIIPFKISVKASYSHSGIPEGPSLPLTSLIACSKDHSASAMGLGSDLAAFVKYSQLFRSKVFKKADLKKWYLHYPADSLRHSASVG